MKILKIYACGELFVVKWQLGIQGSFMKLLAETIGRADSTNREKLMLAFPDEVTAMNQFYYEEGWWTKLCDRLGISKEVDWLRT